MRETVHCHRILKQLSSKHYGYILLEPHCVIEDYTLGCYYVEKETTVLVNIWTIVMDPSSGI